MNKIKVKQYGGTCATMGELTNMNCIPSPNVSQYKCPCDNLPLDGSKQNTYPLSHNPKSTWPQGFGGKRKSKNMIEVMKRKE